MTSPKSDKGWVVVDEGGDILLACPVDEESHIQQLAQVFTNYKWADLADNGYRCLPCTITVSEKAQ